MQWLSKCGTHLEKFKDVLPTHKVRKLFIFFGYMKAVTCERGISVRILSDWIDKHVRITTTNGLVDYVGCIRQVDEIGLLLQEDNTRIRYVLFGQMDSIWLDHD